MKPIAKLRSLLKWLLCVLFGAVLVYLWGPRVSVDVEVWDEALPGLDEISNHLLEQEAGVEGLLPECRKRIEWAGEAGVATPISFVYLHGFSDSNRLQGESISRIAAEFGGNVYYARYAGHGYESEAGVEALGSATLQEWADDSVEALRVGQLLGEKVVVVAFSTGAPLGVWASTKLADGAAPDALVLISPNFGLADRNTELAIGPWGKTVVRLFCGEVNEYGTPPVGGMDGMHERFATSKYGSEAIVTMMAAVKLGRKAELEKLTAPVLTVYSPRDKIISHDDFGEVIAKMGSEIKEEHPMEAKTGHNDDHVLIGSIVSHGNEAATQEVEASVVEFVRKHVSVAAAQPSP
jgi:alpha-beta hydrolase superfamily lysophospholipase